MEKITLQVNKENEYTIPTDNSPRMVIKDDDTLEDLSGNKEVSSLQANLKKLKN